jgi:hypothetical protein
MYQDQRLKIWPVRADVKVLEQGIFLVPSTIIFI